MDLSTFQHSIFLSALGSAIMSSLWQTCFLWIVYKLILILKKSPSAYFKHNVAVLMVCSSFVWFLGNLFSRIIYVPHALVNNSNAPFIDTADTSIIEQLPFYLRSLLPYLSIAYILLLFFLMIKLYASYRQVAFMAKKNLLLPPEYLQQFARTIALRFKSGKNIKVWISKQIHVPATIGFIKPVILIPAASINNLTCEQLEAIILHEFSHIKRNDYLVNLVISFIETVLFFNPFIGLFINIIKEERENCCDDFVLAYRYDPHAYASALLHLEQSRTTNLPFALGAVSGKKELLSRVKRITGNSPTDQFNYKQKLAALLTMTTIFCCLGWISAFKIKKESTAKPMIAATSAGNDSLSTIVIANQANSSEKDKQVSNNYKPSGFIQKNKTKLTAKRVILDSSAIVDKIKKQNENLEFVSNKAGQLEDGLKKAYKEISKIDWNSIHFEIQKGFESMNIAGLEPSQKEALAKAKQHISVFKFNEPEFSRQLLKQLQKDQRTRDSLEIKIINRTNPQAPTQKRLKRRSTEASEKTIEVNGFGSQTYFLNHTTSSTPNRIQTSTPPASFRRPSAKVSPDAHYQIIKNIKTERIIVDI